MSISIKDELFKKFYFWIILTLIVIFTSISVFWNKNKQEENNIKSTYNTFTNKFPNIYPSMSCKKAKKLYPWIQCKVKNTDNINKIEKKDIKKNIEKNIKKNIKKDNSNEPEFIFNDENNEPEYIFNDKDIKKTDDKIDKNKIKKVIKKRIIKKKRNIIKTKNIYYYKEKKEKTRLELFDLKIDKINNSVSLNNCRYTVNEHKFTDDKKTFATKYIKFLQEIWIVKWINWKWKIFSPESDITRAEFLKIVLKSLCIDYSTTVPNSQFSDVKNWDWVSKVVTSALEWKIIKKSLEKFRPNEPITRIEAIKILISASKIKLLDIKKSSFSDIKEIWNIKIIETAKKLNIVNWQKINNKLLFEPNNKLTRAESAKMIVLLLKAKQNLIKK
jgi:hypothetical protein